MALAIFLSSKKRSVSEGELLSKMLLMGERSKGFAISWLMASVSLLKMPAASFEPMSEAILIWEFQAATSWRMSSLHALSSSSSSWETLSKGGRRALHAELILLAKARDDSAQVKAARPQVPAGLALSSASSKALPFLSLRPS
jgi:hypothetical protein